MPTLFAILAIVALGAWTAEASEVVDLLEAGAESWVSPDPSRWSFAEGVIRGSTPLLKGAKTDPDASSFLVSKRTFGGDIVVSIDITFEKGAIWAFTWTSARTRKVAYGWRPAIPSRKILLRGTWKSRRLTSRPSRSPTGRFGPRVSS